jgi:hypothetical protein
MIDFLLTSFIATNAPRISSPPSSPSVNRPARPVSSPSPALPSVPIVYPNRNNQPSSPTSQPSNKSWSDKVWEKYQDRQRNLPSN